MRVVMFLVLMFGAMGAVYLHISHPWPWLWSVAAVLTLLGVVVFVSDVRRYRR